MSDVDYGTWTDNSTNLCYSPPGEEEADAWCGMKDDCSQKGLILPLFLEVTWPRSARAIIYLVGLLYSFLGVSIVADIFMCAIEKITSKTKKIHVAASQDKNDNAPETIEVPVWNGTVANLTLMALGSSAPEILLSCIEIIGNNFEAGALGPGTIVGSAAFNLLAICAVCIVAIPKGEIRRINQIQVFAVTSFFSIFAYLWLLVILKWTSPNVVDLWEAVLTFIFFPILVLIAYAADKHWLNVFCCKSPSSSSVSDKQRQIELGNFQPGEAEGMLEGQTYFKDGQLDKDGLLHFIKHVKKNTKLSDEDAAVLAASKIIDSKPHSRMWYRIGAVRNMTGGRKTQPTVKLNDRLKEVYDAINENPEAPNVTFPDADAGHAIIDFHASSAAVMESVGTYKVTIIRHGRMDHTVKVRVETIDGSANEGEDYEPVNEVLTFEPQEREKQIGVAIVDDNQWEPDEEFFLKLTLVHGEEEEKEVKLGRTSIMEITILNDDEPGTLMFEKRGHLVKESCGDAEISIVRQNGADGEISVKWRTIDKSAVNGKDYKGGEGSVEFKHGETHRMLRIPIIDDMEFEKDENFEIELYEADGGAAVGKINRTAVTITNDDEFNSVMQRMMVMTNANMDGMRVHNETWAQQLKDAMNVNGGDVENASAMDYVMHFLTFGFKLLFALIPPAGMAGGWPCFFVSLAMIGLLTAIVGDLASIFGCLVYLKDPVTAITFVALGTSLPDTFASKAAAVGERYADNAVGNVTGSNSVNVFLGLGLPWLMAAIVHASRGSVFRVDSGTLSFSVTLYAIFAAVTICLLMIRRFSGFFGKAELGGPNGPKYASGVFLVTLWILYVVLSSLQVYGVINPPI